MAKLAKERGYKTVSTIVINNPYGVGFEEVFVKAFEADGGKVLEKIRYDPSQTIFDSEVQKDCSKQSQFVMMSHIQTGSLSSDCLREGNTRQYTMAPLRRLEGRNLG